MGKDAHHRRQRPGWSNPSDKRGLCCKHWCILQGRPPLNCWQIIPLHSTHHNVRKHFQAQAAAMCWCREAGAAWHSSQTPEPDTSHGFQWGHQATSHCMGNHLQHFPPSRPYPEFSEGCFLLQYICLRHFKWHIPNFAQWKVIFKEMLWFPDENINLVIQRKKTTWDLTQAECFKTLKQRPHSIIKKILYHFYGQLKLPNTPVAQSLH